MQRAQVQEVFWAYLFIAPALIGLMIFTIIPIAASFVLSVFSWDFLTPPEFVGLANFQRLSTDSRLLTGFGITATYVVTHVAGTAGLGLLLALAVNRKLSTLLRSSLRAVYFFPVIVSIASVAIIWTYLFDVNRGIIDYYLTQLGGPRIPWLSSSAWAMRSVILMSIWKSLGFNFVLFVAGLQNISREYYEAAEIDGAGSWGKFRHITIPLLSPTVFFIVVIGLIGAFQVFDAPYIMTTGGPGDATRTVGIFIYEHGIRFLRMGYASTIALALFAIIMLITILQFALSKKWVVY
jgi:multiple sugar transport system permease protein